MTSKLKSIALAVALTTVLTGCTPISGNSESKAALQGIKDKPMPGFQLAGSGSGDSFCIAGSYCNPNATLIFTSTREFASRAEFCRELIPWAEGIGADSFQYDPEYIAIPFADREGAAQFACTGANNFSLVGGAGDVRWILTSDGKQMEIQTTLSGEEGLDDPRLALKTWDEAMQELSPSGKLDIDILSAIETYRLANPKANPSSLKTIQAALKDINLPEGTRIVEDAAGKAHYVELLDSPEYKHCLNITPFYPAFFLMNNPGSGFVGLNNLSDDVFGALNYTSCRQP